VSSRVAAAAADGVAGDSFIIFVTFGSVLCFGHGWIEV